MPGNHTFFVFFVLLANEAYVDVCWRPSFQHSNNFEFFSLVVLFVLISFFLVMAVPLQPSSSRGSQARAEASHLFEMFRSPSPMGQTCCFAFQGQKAWLGTEASGPTCEPEVTGSVFVQVRLGWVGSLVHGSSRFLM